MPMITLTVAREDSTTIQDFRIAASGEKNPKQLRELQEELQKLINELDVKVPKLGREIGNTGDESIPFNINGETVIKKDFDENGYAEKLLNKLNEIKDNQPRPNF